MFSQWMESRPNSATCPVCKAVIDKEKLIPLYGRGSENKDPRENVPPRPQGQREEAPQEEEVRKPTAILQLQLHTCSYCFSYSREQGDVSDKLMLAHYDTSTACM